jgi:hypothetical protein
MAKQRPQNLPSDVKPKGPCGLCIGANNNQRVWAVQCTAFTGDVCDDHMELLVKQQNGRHDTPEAILFDKAS